jgi:two-component system, NtrC family, sensor kinase
VFLSRVRVRRALMGTVLLSVAAFIPLDFISGAEQTPLLTGSRLLLLLAYGPTLVLLPRIRRELEGVFFAAIGGSTAVAVAMMCAGTGGTSSPAFSFLWALPLVTGLLFADQPWTSLLTGLASAVAGAVLLSSEGKPPAETAYWIMVTVVATAISTSATAMYRRVQRDELEIQLDRASMLQQLAASEREKARMERLAVVGLLSAGVAHEINNPLSYLKSNLGWIEREASERPLDAKNADFNEVLSESQQGVERIQQIVADLRWLSREQSEPIEACDPQVVIDESCRMASVRTHKHHVLIEVAPGTPPVKGSRRKLVQVVTNLLVNAADAIEHHGERTEAGTIRVFARADGDRVVFEVSDSGPGFTPEMLDRVFEPFGSSRAGSALGLGLALSAEFVRRMDGTLTVANVPTGGARLSVSLPRA